MFGIYTANSKTRLKDREPALPPRNSMAFLLDLASRHALAVRPRLAIPSPRGTPATGSRRTWLSTVRSSAEEPSSRDLHCPCCTGLGRSFLKAEAPLAPISAALPDGATAEGSGASGGSVSSASDPLIFPASEVTFSSRPGWYKEFYAKAMNSYMKSYEAEIARVKGDLFNLLKQGQGTGTRNVLEIGVGTGPNLKYYATEAGGDCIHVYGVDPNEKMEKYASKAAVDAGLRTSSFSFVQGVAEALPVRDSSMDAVIGTLVMCSVSDVSAALREIKRVLKPGGRYVFIEHVAARDGSFLRFLQNVLSPLQQFLSDGCHLNRETGKDISETGFSEVQINSTTIPHLFILGPHVYGVAQK